MRLIELNLTPSDFPYTDRRPRPVFSFPSPPPPHPDPHLSFTPGHPDPQLNPLNPWPRFHSIGCYRDQECTLHSRMRGFEVGCQLYNEHLGLFSKFSLPNLNSVLVCIRWFQIRLTCNLSSFRALSGKRSWPPDAGSEQSELNISYFI